MRRLLFLAAALLVVAGQAAASPSQPSATPDRPDVTLPVEGVITNPDWLQRPTGEEMSNYYPSVASMIGLDGHTSINCEVTALGSVDDCKVESETPAGMGFGDAALALTKYFRMRPTMVDGAPVGGGRVIVPIGFLYPWDQADTPTPTPAPAGPPPSAKALDLARQVAVAFYTPDRIQALMQLARQTLTQQFADVSLTEQEQAALDDFVAASVAQIPQREDADAARYAQLFSEADLAQVAAFFTSPAGRVWLTRSADPSQDEAQAMERSIRLDAKLRFCAKFDCAARRTTSPAPAK